MVKCNLIKRGRQAKKSTPGGSVSLTSGNANKFKLDVPANALEKEVEIKMTDFKTLDGVPLYINTPTVLTITKSNF